MPGWGEEDQELATLELPTPSVDLGHDARYDQELGPHEILEDDTAPPQLRQMSANYIRANPTQTVLSTARPAQLKAALTALPLPGVGHIVNTISNATRSAAQRRIDAGKGTSNDYWTVAGVYEDAVYASEHAKNKEQMPWYMPDPEGTGKTTAFMMELYGLAPVGRGAAALAGGGIRGGAAAIATQATLSGLAAEKISERAAPYIDREGQTQSGQNIGMAALSGFSDAMIEVGVEKAGEHFGKLVPKAVRDRTGRLWQKYIGLNPNGSSAEFVQLLKDSNYNGILSEIGEERLGEILTGGKDKLLGDPRADFGATGDLAAGAMGDRERLQQGLRTVGEEAVQFAPLAIAGGLAGAAENASARRQVTGDEASEILKVNPGPRAQQQNIDSMWASPSTARRAMAKLEEEGRDWADIETLANNPTSANFEDAGFGSRRDGTMPNAASRRAFGDNLKKLFGPTQPDVEFTGEVESTQPDVPPSPLAPPGPDQYEKIPQQPFTDEEWEAAKPNPAAGQQSQTNVASPPVSDQQYVGKQPWELSPDELDESIRALKEMDRGLEASIFGEEGAKRYRAAQQVSNSTLATHEKTKRADQVIAEMEAALTEPQRRRLFGMDGPAIDIEELKAFRREKSSIDAATPESLGQSIGVALVSLGDASDPATMTFKQQLAMAKLAEGKRLAEANGFDLAAVEKAAARHAASKFSDPDDAMAVLGRWFQGKPKPKTPGLPAPTPTAPEPIGPSPFDRGSKSWPDILQHQAKKWDVDPATYNDIAKQVWDEEIEYIRERESARKQAAKSLRLNAGNLQMIENQGKDFASIKGFDEVARSLANDYPVLGWVHLVDENSSELEQKLWDLLREGQQKIPTKVSPEYHQKVERYMSEAERNTRFDPDEFEGREPALTASDDVLFAARPTGLEGVSKKLGDLLQKYMTSRGNLPQPVFLRKEAKEGAVGEQTQQLQFLVNDLRDALAKSTGSAKMTAAGAAKLDAAMKGNVQLMGTLPQPVQDALKAMRDHVDTLSRRMIDSGAAEGNLQLTIEQNLGTYVTRSYRVFDDPKWAEKVSPQVKARAHAWLRAQYPNKTDAEIENIIGDMLYKKDAPIKVLAGLTLGEKDLSITRKRKGIAPEIRALLGEYTDPIVNYTRSVTKMANLIANHELLAGVKEDGLGKFLFERNDPNRPEGFNAEFAAPNDSELAPLNGLMAAPEFVQAMEDVYRQPVLGPWMRRYMGLVLATKYAKTVGSIAAQVRNFVGNIEFALANGHWRLNKMGDAFAAAGQEVAANLPGPVRRILPKWIRDNAAWRDRLKHYKRLGVVDGSVHGGELKEAIRDAIDKPPGVVAESTAEKAVEMLRTVGTVASTVYQTNDNLWKVYAFENERSRLKAAHEKAGQPLSDAELDTRAVEIVRNTMPTYSMVPEAVKQLRRAPFIGSFVSFPAEVIRTRYKAMQLAVEELKDPVRRGIGATRLAGQLSTLAAPYAITAAARFLLGITDDDDEDLRQFMPPWEKNSDILWLSNEPGNPKYIDLSWTFPSSTLRKPGHALLREGPEEALAEAGAPFFSEDILTSKVLDVARNKTGSTGRQVYNPSDSTVAKVGSSSAHVGGAMMPGTLESANRIYKGATGHVDPSGRSYDASTEALAASTGFRVRSLNLEESLGFRARGFGKQQTDTRRIFTTVFNSRGTVTQSEVEAAYTRMEAARQEQFEEMHRAVLAAVRLGVPEENVQQILVDNDIGQAEAARIVAGTYVPYQPSKQMIAEVERLPGGEGRLAGLRGAKQKPATAER
jgi:hypothetical protein